MGRDAEVELPDPHDDGLAMPEIGPWGRRKYHFLARYLNIFTTAMKEKWSQLHYIDLFAGAGFARIRDSNDVVYTSPMIAATLQHPFTCLHLCDKNPANCIALKARLDALPCRPRFNLTNADSNEFIGEMLAGVPARGALSVTFADPFGLHLDFNTVREIAKRQSDLIVLMADNMDALRNWATYYQDNPGSSLDRFMGESGWREVLKSTPSARQAEALRKRYIEKLKTLGYSEFDTEGFRNSRGADIYSLVFASRNRLGLKFWREARKVDEQGQRGLPFTN
ncbi:MAG: three-Cys-motif partner protein TcmP [Phycisphaeraceae bacterium]|nr:three-Cys-motif partner protein TcmP [Phycisphaeraceae bacterium]